MARSHPVGQLLLGEPDRGATHEHKPGDVLVRSETLVGSAVLGVATSPAGRSLTRQRSNWIRAARAHFWSLPILVRGRVSSRSLQACTHVLQSAYGQKDACSSLHPLPD